jgi:hypothetical protein
MKPDSEHDQISLNMEAVQEFYVRESGKLRRPQRLLERLTERAGQALFSLSFWFLSVPG